MNEVGKGGLQEKIIASVAKQGGLALKTHGTLVKGMPDLVIAFPNLCLHMAEVKHLGPRVRLTPILPPLSPMQKVTIDKLAKITSNVVILTGAEHSGKLYLYLTRRSNELLDFLLTPCVIYHKRLGFDILWLMNAPPMSRVA